MNRIFVVSYSPLDRRREIKDFDTIQDAENHIEKLLAHQDSSFPTKIESIITGYTLEFEPTKLIKSIKIKS